MADHFSDQLLGYFIPQTSGNYVFFINSDDGADLYLSTDASFSNRRLIALASPATEPRRPPLDYGYVRSESALSEAGAHTSHPVRRQSLGPDSAADLHHGSHSFLTCRLAGAAKSGGYHDCGLCPGRLAGRSLRLRLLRKFRFLPRILFSTQQILLP